MNREWVGMAKDSVEKEGRVDTRMCRQTGRPELIPTIQNLKSNYQSQVSQGIKIHRYSWNLPTSKRV